MITKNYRLLKTKAKNLIYFAYHPHCDKQGDVLVIDTDAELDAEKPFHSCHVVFTAEGDTSKSKHYTRLSAKALLREQSLGGKLPTRIFVAKRTEQYSHT